ncbi:hypothetical protein RFI_09885 [Reticulomyxa filosa]|uniref:PH domain-containing protein n=1 Tax=Reticulomyxa filosa TaxID=46433 RepID=X6NMT7_RETFI|nr:hypothetical protein RFI_09885 [Reticulomyxa filosa]|eukprot:ETO27248.1 hypothetical protein RFI_09885 [Reticulomyxa filosa]
MKKLHKHYYIYIIYIYDMCNIRYVLQLFINIGGKKKITSVTLQEGWVYKMGEAISGLEGQYWRKRWLSLVTHPPRLVYREHCDSKEVKGVIDLKNILRIEKIVDETVITKQYQCPTLYVFECVTSNRTWIFACLSDDECNIWIERIRYFQPKLHLNAAARSNAKEQASLVDDSKNRHHDHMLSATHVNHEHSNLLLTDRSDNGKGLIPNPNESMHRSNPNASKVIQSVIDTTEEKNPLPVTRPSLNNRAGVIAQLLRRVSGVAEYIGLAEQRSVIRAVQPKGTVVDSPATDIHQPDTNANAKN